MQAIAVLMYLVSDRFLYVLQIGTVFASENYICPNAVGVDIGMTPSNLYNNSTHAFLKHCWFSENISMCMLPDLRHCAQTHRDSFWQECQDCEPCGLHAAGCGMCAVPVDGLHKDDVTHEQLVKIQGLLKRRIPTGTTSCLHPSISPTLLLCYIHHQFG